VLAWAITGQVQAWFWAGLAFHPHGLDPATARVIFAIPTFWGPLINGAAMTIAVSFAALGFGARRMIPTWLAWLSVVFFVEQGIETITVFGTSGFIAPGGAMNDYLGGVIGIAWVIGVIAWGYGQLGEPRDADRPTGRQSHPDRPTRPLGRTNLAQLSASARTADTSNSRVIFSEMSTPPESSGALKLIPQSLRFTVARPSNPMR
jgi:hypothetical protein